jgi:hypothetical protein
MIKSDLQVIYLSGFATGFAIGFAIGYFVFTKNIEHAPPRVPTVEHHYLPVPVPLPCPEASRKKMS